MEIIRIAALGLTGVLLALLVKEIRPSYGLYITFATSIGVMFFSVGKITYVISSLKDLKNLIPVEPGYLTVLLKMMGITYVGQFSASICQDAGYAAVAKQIEIFEKIAIMTLSIPVLTALLETVYEFLG